MKKRYYKKGKLLPSTNMSMTVQRSLLSSFCMYVKQRREKDPKRGFWIVFLVLRSSLVSSSSSSLVIFGANN